VTNSKCRFKDTSNVPDQKIFHAHGLGVNSVSWAPSTTPGSLVSSSGGAQGLRRFVTGGSDNLVRIWSFDTASQSYKEESAPLAGHTDWVRDVAWSPTGMFMTSISVKRGTSSFYVSLTLLQFFRSPTLHLHPKTKPSVFGHPSPHLANGPIKN